jgi:hypothetical protein
MLTSPLPPDAILQVLRDELELSDDEINLLTPKERFNKWCDWEGLIHYGDKLWELVEESMRLEGRPRFLLGPPAH